jgi:hypothetical protein
MPSNPNPGVASSLPARHSGGHILPRSAGGHSASSAQRLMRMQAFLTVFGMEQ